MEVKMALKNIETIRVWERGQITIPRNLRKELEIKQDDILYAEIIGQGIFLKPKESAIYEIQKKGEELLRQKGLTIKDILDEKN